MLSIVVSLLVMILCVAPASAVFDSGALTKQLKSGVYYVQSLDEGAVLFKNSENKKVQPAGFVKLISAVVAIEKWNDLEETVKVTEKNLSLVRYDYGVKKAEFKAGEKISKRDLINSLIVYSANDAASIIAYEISGSTEAFLKEVAATLSKIGCTSTVLKNITGFDADGQYTTASDIAKIIRYAMNYPAFSEAFSASEITLKATSLNEERTLSANNRMRNKNIADYYHASVNAGKYTSTSKAGECIAVVSNQDGYSYLSVVMNGKLEDIDKDGVKENTSMTDTKKMLDWIYKNIRYRVVVSPSQIVAVMNVTAGANADDVKLVPEKELSALVPSNATPASVLYEIVEGSAPQKLRAPVKQGEILAKAKVYYAGQELAEVNLVAQQDVRLSFFGLIFSKISAIMSSGIFIALVGIAAAVCIAYLVIMLKNFLMKDVEKAVSKKEPGSKPQKNTKKAFNSEVKSAPPAQPKPRRAEEVLKKLRDNQQK